MTLILGKKVILVTYLLKITFMCSAENMQKTAWQEAFLTPVPVCTHMNGGRPGHSTVRVQAAPRALPAWGKSPVAGHMSLLPLAMRLGLAATAARSLQVRKSHRAPGSAVTCVQTPTDGPGPHMWVPPSLISQTHTRCNLKTSFCLLIYFSFQITYQKK